MVCRCLAWPRRTVEVSVTTVPCISSAGICKVTLVHPRSSICMTYLVYHRPPLPHQFPHNSTSQTTQYVAAYIARIQPHKQDQKTCACRVVHGLKVVGSISGSVLYGGGRSCLARSLGLSKAPGMALRPSARNQLQVTKLSVCLKHIQLA